MSFYFLKQVAINNCVCAGEWVYVFGWGSYIAYKKLLSYKKININAIDEANMHSMPYSSKQLIYHGIYYLTKVISETNKSINP